MSEELHYRTEDMTPEDIDGCFVETPQDRLAIDALKAKQTVILQGARGVGKSFLLKVAQRELDANFQSEKVLAVYLTFNKAGLLQTSDPTKFKHWMLSKICSRILRAARKQNILGSSSSIFSSLLRDSNDTATEDRLTQLQDLLEESWKRSESAPPVDSRIDPQIIKDAVEDLCDYTGIRRVVLLIDEAAHVFIPEQQRQFFTLIRDLRSPYISVKAAVYPGVTYFGESFQLSHDAELIDANRNALASDYLASMRDMVLRQDSTLEGAITKYGEDFDALAFASSGNPRILFKTLTLAGGRKLNRNQVQQTMKSYYREAIWSEHSSLGDRYTGHRGVIDWGRDFIESHVIPTLAKSNGRNDWLDKRVFIWIHRDAPAAVKESLRLLCYSGILHEAGTGLVATRRQIGTRYMLNVGVRTSRDADPVPYATWLRKSAQVKRMMEFGANHPTYEPIERISVEKLSNGQNELIKSQLGRPTAELELTAFLRSKLKGMGFNTVGKVLAASEGDFQQARQIGPVRSRQMMNAATTAVLEYLSG